MIKVKLKEGVSLPKQGSKMAVGFDVTADNIITSYSGIKEINPENLKHIKGLNITFLTHSPYILSDIPNAFVLKLIKGEPYIEGNETFGANVHDLLANDFFMQKGFMGEWAKSQIKLVIESLTLKINNKKIESLNGLLNEETEKNKIAIDFLK